MGEHILRVSLGELSVIRVRCKSCGTVVEVPVQAAGSVHGKCACGSMLFGSDGSGATPLSDFQTAIGRLAKLPAIDVEFPIKLPD